MGCQERPASLEPKRLCRSLAKLGFGMENDGYIWILDFDGWILMDFGYLGWILGSPWISQKFLDLDDLDDLDGFENV